MNIENTLQNVFEKLILSLPYLSLSFCSLSLLHLTCRGFLPSSFFFIIISINHMVGQLVCLTLKFLFVRSQDPPLHTILSHPPPLLHCLNYIYQSSFHYYVLSPTYILCNVTPPVLVCPHPPEACTSCMSLWRMRHRESDHI